MSHLLNIDEALAAKVADGLGLPALPAPAQAARPTIANLAPSAALSIVANGPPTFKGRKLGILLSDGADSGLFNGLVAAVTKVGALYEVIAPKIGGVTLSDGTKVAAKQKIDGGPSVLFDAVAVIVSEEGGALLAADAATQDFVRDALPLSATPTIYLTAPRGKARHCTPYSWSCWGLTSEVKSPRWAVTVPKFCSLLGT